MPVGTRSSSRRGAGEVGLGDQTESLESLSSPRKRVSRSTKIKKSEEETKSIPEETLDSENEKTDASNPVESKDGVSLDQNIQEPNPFQSLDTSSVASERVESAEKTFNTAEVAYTKKGSAGDETAAKEVINSRKQPADETKAPCDVIKSVMEAYKQESTTQKRFKGMPKSGRPWKTEQTARFSDMRKDKPLKSSWQLKMAQKAEKLSVRKYQQELIDAKRQAILLKKQRREEHQKKKEENQKKSEVVQVIKNPAKLKRMKKKQLRMIKKR
ncbi:coiled-coil domain-containing protein 86-like [Lytechinus pictus]|uniref:coiled-coil domain-containing protein 86-like n=1 Tax=Lytechinus pictus TaxID=7653 RepID=UPI0030BA184C